MAKTGYSYLDWIRRESLVSATGDADMLKWKIPAYELWKRLQVSSGHKTINNSLPPELLREIFLDCIEGHQMKSGHLASVCRYWRSVITSIARLWSTVRVGTWTEREQVDTWLQRAYPRRVIIDTQRDGQRLSNTSPFAALQYVLESTGQWHELTISSFPPEHYISGLNFQVATPMNMLRALRVDAGCMPSSSFARVLNLVPSTDAALSELKLYPPFASAYFLQPHWFPVLQYLTVLIVNGRGIKEPFDLLPAFTQLQIFEADHLLLPPYGPNANLPLLHTLQKLRLRASSVQWVAGREFPCLWECAIILPRHPEAVQRLGVQMPSCWKLTYYGYPIATIQRFHVPQIKAMEIGSHDFNQRRTYQQLLLLRSNGRISSLTALHLTLQWGGRGLINILKYLVSLQDLTLSIAYPSSSWGIFLESLAAKPSTRDWPKWYILNDDHKKWQEWCSSQTWHANILPSLKYLGIQSPKGFSQSQCLDSCPLLRLVAWTRAQSTPLKHLKVWEGRGTIDEIVVDYVSTSYLDKHLGTSELTYDSIIVRGMITQSLLIVYSKSPLFKPLHSTVLFRQLQALTLSHLDDAVDILSYLEQIKRLHLWESCIPAYSLDIDIPLTRTLQKLWLKRSPFSWMLGRAFTSLKSCMLYYLTDISEDLSHAQFMGLRVDMPVCTTLQWEGSSVIFSPFCCPKLQSFRWRPMGYGLVLDETVLKSLYDFLLKCPCLQELEISIYHYMRPDLLIQFVFYGAWEQKLWRDIRNVEVEVRFDIGLRGLDHRNPFMENIAGHQQHYGKWWKEFTVTDEYCDVIILKGSM